MSIKADAMIVAGGVALVVIGFAYMKSAAGDALAAAAPLVNPTDPNNIVNQGVTGVVQAVSGDPNASLGTKLYDLFHPSAINVQ